MDRPDDLARLIRSDLPAGKVEWALARIINWSRRQDVQRAIVSRSGHDLTLGHASTLALIVEHGPLRLSELADRLGIDGSTLTPRVRQLVNAEFVRCFPDTTDGRATRIEATSKGQRAFSDLHATHRKFIEDALAHLTAVERDTLGRALGSVADHLEAGPWS